MAAVLFSQGSTRVKTKAQIKRASATARRKMNQLDRQVLQQTQGVYKRAADEISESINRYSDTAENLRLNVLQGLQGQIQAVLQRASAIRNELLDQGLNAAADLGASAYDSALTVENISQVSVTAASFVREFIAADGLSLSDRLWRLDRAASELMGNAVQNAVIQGHSASQAVNDLMAKGEPVPADLLEKLNLSKSDRVRRIAIQRLLHGEKNPRVMAMRVMRTELNRAHGEAYIAAGEEHEDFSGWRFLLSPRHPETDICDMHAQADVYGLGSGVYPDRKSCPWPAHPNTLSYVEIVFSDEVEANQPQSRTDWLKGQSSAVQASVLNSSQKAAALRANILRDNQIATPWYVLEKRYKKQGINVDKLAAPMQPRIPKTIPAGQPVSAALKPNSHKRVAERVFAAIDAVHGDGRLPIIPIARHQSTSRLGSYSYYGGELNIPIKISLSSSKQKEFTLVHEIGHFLDHMGFSGDGFASLTRPGLMEGWIDAVEASAAIKTLRQLKQGPGVITVGDSYHVVNKRVLDYYLNPKETWARAYSQYIALRSGDSLLQQQVKNIVDANKTALFPYPDQWESEDFEAIAQSIDRLFSILGWRK